MSVNDSKEIVIATTNTGKLREFSRILSSAGYKVYSLQDFDACTDAVEDGKTFQENAKKKAKHYFDCIQKPLLADDSGLCVSALNGAPGIHSARYGGEGLSDRERRHYLLENMKGKTDRHAYFMCVLALTYDGREFKYFEGRTEGEILHKDAGEGGFGYDPVFFSPEIKKSFGEASSEEKDSISHRGRAILRLRDWLAE